MDFFHPNRPADGTMYLKEVPAGALVVSDWRQAFRLGVLDEEGRLYREGRVVIYQVDADAKQWLPSRQRVLHPLPVVAVHEVDMDAWILKYTDALLRGEREETRQVLQLGLQQDPVIQPGDLLDSGAGFTMLKAADRLTGTSSSTDVAKMLRYMLGREPNATELRNWKKILARF